MAKNQPTTPDLQPEKVPTTPEKKQKPWLVIGLAVLLVISLGTTGFLAYQNYQLKQKYNKSLQSTPTPSVNIENTPSPSFDSPDELKTCSEPPVVVIEPSLSDAQKEKIQKKIVEPYVDFHRDYYGEGYLVSLLIQNVIDEDVKDQYPYTLVGIMSNGANHWKSLSQTNGELDWWLPECMGGCDYSETFKQKYPQIVSITNP